MENKIKNIKQWLGNDAINIFGIQFSGKDTIGMRLAMTLEANLIGSGDIVRSAMKNNQLTDNSAHSTKDGNLTPTDDFKRLILPYILNPELNDKPLVLNSVGRWIGEEEFILDALNKTNRKLKAVVVLNISQDTVWERWRRLGSSRNGGRDDDTSKEKVSRRLAEFHIKTEPVINKYRQMGLVIDVDSTSVSEITFQKVIDALDEYANHHN